MAVKKKVKASGKVKSLPVRGLKAKDAREIKGLTDKGNHVPQ